MHQTRFASPIVVLFVLILSAPAAGKPPAYDPLETFAPLALPDAVNANRSGAGIPGSRYWQNRADYWIYVSLDPATKTLGGTATIEYTNNSPDVLDAVWLQLDQNHYRRDARAAAMIDGGRTRDQFTEGYRLDAVEAIGAGGKFERTDYLITDTRMKVTLPRVLKATGGKTKLRIKYSFVIPGAFGGRTGWSPVSNGEVYNIAQWYPRMHVYDDVRGWDTLPYLINEFYLEYGAFEYAVTVPANMTVAGSGDLTNPGEVLTTAERLRLAEAHHSDATVVIRRPQHAGAAPPSTATKTWRFRIDNARDVAFAVSDIFVWDAARINLPNGKHALAQSLYPAESGGLDAWSRSTEYIKNVVEDFSRRWFAYPYPTATNVAGPVSGMEYPGIFFNGMADKGKELFYLSAHEAGHTWFPMIVGTDERRYSWMDEGFATFIGIYASDDFNRAEYGPKRDREYAPRADMTPGEQIAEIVADAGAPAITTRSDAIREMYRHDISYFKAAYGLILLREVILGPERFDPAFRKYIAAWAFKHPKPSDFFRVMESEGGEDLSWFWRGFFFNTWQHDLAVTNVSYSSGAPRQGAQVTVTNLGQLVLPAVLRVTFRDGTVQSIKIPVETWMQGASRDFQLGDGKEVAEAIVDPEHLLPDIDRLNNIVVPK